MRAVYRSDLTYTEPMRYDYVYNYTDHLGNIRVSYTKFEDFAKTIEETNYYPFGLKHGNYNNIRRKISLKQATNEKTLIPTNVNGYKYKYNGKEWQNEFGINLYDFDARNYDPAIGAMKIDFGGDIGVVDVLDKIINDKKRDVNIVQSKDDRHSHLAGKINFADKFGIITATKAGVSMEDIQNSANSGNLTDGVAKNSATAQLGHEIIHAYNYHYDRGKRIYDKKTRKRIWDPKIGGFYIRRRNTATRTFDTNKRSYLNGEEKRTTTLSNQINIKLRESARWDHRELIFDGNYTLKVADVIQAVYLKIPMQM